MIDAATELPPRPEPAKAPTPIAQVELSVPERMKAGYIGEAFNSNRMTGIPEKNDGARGFLATRLASTIKAEPPEPNGWVCLYGDLDQLKVVNDRFGRDAGDRYIKWGVTTALTTLSERVPFSQKALIIPVRQGDAADEISVWMFRLSPEELAQVKKLVDDGQFPSDEIQMSDGKASVFEFSSSYGVVTSADPELQADIDAAREYMKGEDKVPWDLFNKIEQVASKFALEEKIAKELTRIPITELFQPNHIDEFIGLLTSDFGGGRISADVLEILLKLQSIKAVSSVAPEQYKAMLAKIGVDDDDLEAKVNAAPTAKEKTEILVGRFQDLFGKVED